MTDEQRMEATKSYTETVWFLMVPSGVPEHLRSKVHEGIEALGQRLGISMFVRETR